MWLTYHCLLLFFVSGKLEYFQVKGQTYEHTKCIFIELHKQKETYFRSLSFLYLERKFMYYTVK